MTQVTKEEWVPCADPVVSDVIRWREPLWDKPNKPRGKPDKIGEQRITAKLLDRGGLAELQVIEVTRLSLMDGAKDEPSKIKKDDVIRRRISSLQSGGCEKLLQEA